MSKNLKPVYMDKCIGCEMCVFEAQRQLKKVGLEESLIRVFRKKSESDKKVTFELDIDPRVNVLNTDKIVSICPKNVLELIENPEK